MIQNCRCMKMNTDIYMGSRGIDHRFLCLRVLCVSVVFPAVHILFYLLFGLREVFSFPFFHDGSLSGRRVVVTDQVQRTVDDVTQ